MAESDPVGEPGRSHHPLAGQEAAGDDAAVRTRRINVDGGTVVGTCTLDLALPDMVLVEATGTFAGLRAAGRPHVRRSASGRYRSPGRPRLS